MSNSAKESIAKDPIVKDLVAEGIVAGIRVLVGSKQVHYIGSYIEDSKAKDGSGWEAHLSAYNIGDGGYFPWCVPIGY